MQFSNRRRRARATLALLLGLTAAAPAGADAARYTTVAAPRAVSAAPRAAPAPQAPPLPAPTPEAIAAAARLRIDLITMGPGDAVWERFGHNALRVYDPATGMDVTYNWGMFDFAAEDFYPRFLRGDMLYWMAPFDTRAVVYAYMASNRSVYAQELNLTAEQKARLVAFLEWNDRDENRYYAYHYYRDNCSTRVRDAIDYALGGQLREALSDVATDATYRSHTRRLTADDLPIYTGLTLAMGPSIDRPLSAWEESFLPLELRRHVRGVRVRGGGGEGSEGREEGEAMPLVASETVLFEADRAEPPAMPPDRIPGYLAAGALLGTLFLALGRFAARGARTGRVGLVALGGVWAFVVGTLGTVIALLWAFTRHDVTYANENLLQVNPIPLALVVLLPMAVVKGRAWRAAEAVAWVVAGASAAGLLLQALPGLDQVNGEIIALALPAHLGLAGALRIARRRTAAPEDAAAPRAAPARV